MSDGFGSMDDQYRELAEVKDHDAVLVGFKYMGWRKEYNRFERREVNLRKCYFMYESLSQVYKEEGELKGKRFRLFDFLVIPVKDINNPSAHLTMRRKAISGNHDLPERFEKAEIEAMMGTRVIVKVEGGIGKESGKPWAKVKNVWRNVDTQEYPELENEIFVNMTGEAHEPEGDGQQQQSSQQAPSAPSIAPPPTEQSVDPVNLKRKYTLACIELALENNLLTKENYKAFSDWVNDPYTTVFDDGLSQIEPLLTGKGIELPQKGGSSSAPAIAPPPSDSDRPPYAKPDDDLPF